MSQRLIPTSIRRTRATRLVLCALTAGLLTAGCGSSLDVSEGSSGTAEVSGFDPADAAQRAAADRWDVTTSQIGVDEPRALDPSDCTLVTVFENEYIHQNRIGVVVFPDGSAITGGTDEAFAEVAQRCFIDEGLVPEVDVAVAVSHRMASMPGPVYLPDEGRRPGELDDSGADSAPFVTELDDGFSVTFYVENEELYDVDLVTTTVDSQGARTTSEPIG